MELTIKNDEEYLKPLIVKSEIDTSIITISIDPDLVKRIELLEAQVKKLMESFDEN